MRFASLNVLKLPRGNLAQKKKVAWVNPHLLRIISLDQCRAKVINGLYFMHNFDEKGGLGRR
jgi:hypothetical protein